MVRYQQDAPINLKDIMFANEDCTAAKLAGYNCLIKFKDSKSLFLKGPFRSEDDESDWHEMAEQFINGPEYGETFPYGTIALDRSAVKYIIKL